eukprot:CAMPEP_0201941462 /NCGR_PEP_ID=MMETSP0903-20130614/47184_1 /ASSEMBLY_ACC=CAM_ASM_000552 /TAXON_ID=420261 /ORGANISM="Thalassiosira antarctica, Strain CCMP982" /LENGTH=298 /DNA_ID=CAMNT_0048483535 /DNA_START=226 /DNA_END=1122 /DNA_ORIENTATION=-
MTKSQRKRIISADRKAILAFKSRGTSAVLPFQADPDDHCETSPLAYTHIAPLLHFIAGRLGKKPCDLEIYDPYYCAGGMVRHLNKLGFQKVHNKCEDFYEVVSQKRVPSHDVVLTNPPYSGDHFDRLLAFLEDNDKPALLLLPEHFSKSRKSSSSNDSNDKFCFLSPPERYHYWTPEGMRPALGLDEKKRKKQHRNLVLGSRNSPFASHWFVCMSPVVTNDSFVSLVKNGGEVQLVEGCCIHNKQESILPTAFKGTIVQSTGEENNGGKKKRRRRNKKQTNDPPGDDHGGDPKLGPLG